MKHILIDLGNTSLKWTTANDVESNISQPNLIPQNTLFYSGKLSYDDLKAFFSNIKNQALKVFICSVASVDAETLLQKYFDSLSVDVVFLDMKDIIAMSANEIGKYDGLGLDRWAAGVGAKKIYSHFFSSKSSLAIVDIGSAITIDVIDGDGYFLPGIIFPGENLMRRALNDYTSNIGYKPDIGTNKKKISISSHFQTLSCVDNGVRHAVQSAVCAGISGLSKELGKDINVVMTGGGVELSTEWAFKFEYCKALVLIGVNFLRKEVQG